MLSTTAAPMNHLVRILTSQPSPSTQIVVCSSGDDAPICPSEPSSQYRRPCREFGAGLEGGTRSGGPATSLLQEHKVAALRIYREVARGHSLDHQHRLPV